MMLVRRSAAASRAWRAPRPLCTATLPLSLWSRNYAKDNKPRPAPRKPTYTKPPSQSSKPTLAGKAPAQHAASQPPVNRPGPGTSRIQDELNTISSAAQGFKKQESGAVNDEADSASPSPAGTESHSRQPLPDLTQGIPSTIDAELRSQSANLTETNLTDEPAATADGIGRGSGGGGGELPKSGYISSIERRRNRNFNYMYAALLLFAISGTVYLGRNWESVEEEEKYKDAPSGWGFKLFYNRARARLAGTLDYYKEPTSLKLLPDPESVVDAPPTLVLSLEDLIVHSEWTREHGWRYAKRPGVDYFIRYLQQYYELVLFTSVPYSLAEPVLKKLDPFHFIMWPLFREQTRYENGQYIKDLSYLNRDLSKVILIDTVPEHAKLQPENAIIIPKWKGDPQDKELISYIPFLEYVATMGLKDTRSVLKSFEGKHIPTEFAHREALARKKFYEDLAKERGSRPRAGKSLFNSVLGISQDGEQSASDGEAMKMPQDRIRERGLKQYEMVEKEIREKGPEWLKNMNELDEKDKEEQMKMMKDSLTGMFTNTGSK